ncbi:J domain-containing protein [uncultured Pontibacter sp.]|uniref:J domain-containing protein n=1 Tax=uncultured Pontibacter sp. TaxID=453356 RepID=UPI002639A45B|nr:J domain-containing protein [uncultured Pontibacter sp.]
MIKNYYLILKVERDASGSDIKKAYRDAAIRLHPDKNDAPTAHHDFVELNEAFHILSDVLKRKQYDTLYNHFILQNGENLEKEATSKFESARSEAQKKSEEIASSNFYIFTTELLTEMVGHVLIEGLFTGVGSMFKGTGEVLGEVLSNIDVDF